MRALFIDEIQSIDTLTQHVLLPLLDSPRRIGGHNRSDRPLREPLYVILATNHAITDLQWREQFRADLWYRMVSYHVDIPALAERGPEVIYSYMKRFLAPAAPENVFEADALEKLTHQAWPGNVRELQTLCQRAGSQWKMEPARISLPQLAQLGFREEVPRRNGPLAPPPDPREAGSMALREYLLAALEEHNWKQTETAHALGWAIPRLNKWITRLGLRERVKESRKIAKRPPR
jgi:DNA-binding NtrC family response regulator